MERRKLTKEDIDKVRDIEGFPIGDDENIISLSDAPYYTACPNPFIEDFIRENGTPYDEETDDYHREPFASDVSEGKTDPIYTAHTYHTKVPYKAIMRYILHYTEPGDIVFDGFCGSGMTGVAAQMCGKKDELIDIPDNNKLGDRYAILSDISPVAQQITYGYNTPFNASKFAEMADEVISECEKECGWVYQTVHASTSKNNLFKEPLYGRINYTVWSDVFICPHCGNEFVFYNVAYDEKKNKINDKFCCPQCSAILSKRDCERAREYIYSDVNNEVHECSKQTAVLINYTFGGKKYTKSPDEYDLQLIEKINKIRIPYWFPTERMCEGKEGRRNDVTGLTHVHYLYSKRNLYVLSCLNDKIGGSRLRIAFQAVNPRLTSKLVCYNMGNRGNTSLSGTLYVPSLVAESDVLKVFRSKIKDIISVYSLTSHFKGAMCNTASSTCLKNIPGNTIDYIFTDPPFGANLNYSELNFIWETWLNVITNSKEEAIINEPQGKGLVEYQQLMTSCFKEFYRILKPNRWMTVEFHNSQNSVWNAIQESLLKAGFVIADVRTLNKQQGSFKQVTTTSAVKQDLVISAYKPRDSFKKDFLLHAGTEDSAWDFVRQHLSNIPVVVHEKGKIEIIDERQAYLLFDRMVAYHIMQGVSVPIDATEFYRGLDEKFIKRDNMYFLPDQVNEYDSVRIKTDIEPVQLEMFVTNEKSAISWLYQHLSDEFGGPKTYAQLQPMFMQETKTVTVDKFEKIPELSVLLDENFLQDEKGYWYVPNITKEGDVAKLREKNLWKEFEGYLNSKGKLKLFRSEAIRVGFARLWKEKNYKAIVEVAERLPEQVIQEDPNLLMYYDNSFGRI